MQEMLDIRIEQLDVPESIPMDADTNDPAKLRHRQLNRELAAANRRAAAVALNAQVEQIAQSEVE